MIAATQPARVQDISIIDGEDDTGTPRRDITLAGPRDRLQALAAFFERQLGPFAVQSVDLTTEGLEGPISVAYQRISVWAPPRRRPQGGPAALRVADLRRSRPAEQLNFVRIDGTAAGSLETSDDANPSSYRSMPAGTYVVVTNQPGGGEPVLRQVLTLDPGVTYTLALFSAAESSQMALQLAPDGPPTGPTPDSAVRLLHAASAAGSVYLALVAPGMVEPMVLANQAGYGLITGYAAVPAGRYDAVVSANGREWRQPVEFVGGEPMSLLLTDGPDGPLLRTLRDVPEAPAALNPPTLTMPASGSGGGHDQGESACDGALGWKADRGRIVRRHHRGRSGPDGQGATAAAGETAERCVAAHGCAAARARHGAVVRAVRLRRRLRRRTPRRQNNAVLHQRVRARGRGGEAVRRARPVDDTVRLAPTWTPRCD